MSNDIAGWWDTGSRRAYLIGASKYEPPLVPLVTPRDDANAVGDILEGSHGFITTRLASGTVGLREIDGLLDQMRAEVRSEDRVLFYFAGHGVAPDADVQRAGYLLPETARRDDPTSFLSMDYLYQRLVELPCRHLLIILDCCFAGSLRWARVRPARDLGMVPEGRIYLERFRRFLDRPAWQLLTSAGAGELAADILFGQRETGADHSPFAQALLDGLAGQADYRVRGGQIVRDRVITLGKLFDFLADRMRQVSNRQTVGYAPLDRHGDGEFLFLVPETDPGELGLPSVLPKLQAHNPYLGLKPYDFSGPAARPLFGRGEARRELAEFVTRNALTVVTGASGSGKSSLVRAGLMRDLAERPDWLVIPPVRPRGAPLVGLTVALESAISPIRVLADQVLDAGTTLVDQVRKWLDGPDAGRRLLLCVDQFEDLLTQQVSDAVRDHFCELLGNLVKLPHVHLVVAVRSDYERQFGPNPGSDQRPSALAERWATARFPVPPLSDDELRALIRGPANERAVAVQQVIVDALIREAGGRVGELPLLAATLEEIYVHFVNRVDPTNVAEWTITDTDYKAVGGVPGGVVRRFERLWTALLEHKDGDHTPTLRRVLLRMVSQDGVVLAKRQVPHTELIPDPEADIGGAESKRITRTLESLDEARLIVFDTRPANEGTEEVVEPIHDVAVRGWPRMTDDWLKEVQGRADEKQGLSLPQRRRLTEDVARCRAEPLERRSHFTWAKDPALPAAERELNEDPLAFNMTETDFIRASLRLRQVSGRRSTVRLTIVVALIVTLLCAVGAIFAEARLRGLAAESRRLAAQADTIGATRPDLAALLSVQATHTHATVEASASVLRAVQRQPQLVRFCTGQVGDVEHLAFSPDGRRLVAANSGSTPIRLAIWDVGSGQVIATHSYQFSQVMELAVSADQCHAAVSFAGGTIRLLDYTTGHYLDWDPFENGISFDSRLVFDTEGQYLLANSGPRVWRLHVPTGMHTFHVLGGHADEVPDIGFQVPFSAIVLHPDGRTVDSGGYDGLVLRHDLVSDTRTEVAKLGRPVNVLAFDTTSERLASGTDDGRIVVHSPAFESDVEVRPPDSGAVKKIRFADGGAMLAAEFESTDRRTQIALWRVETGSPPIAIEPPRILFDFIFDHAGENLASAGSDSQLRIHRTADGSRDGGSLVGGAFRNYRVLFSPTAPSLLASAGDNGAVIVWNIARTSRLAAPIISGLQLPSEVQGVAFSPSGDTVVGGGTEGMLFLRSGDSEHVIVQHISDSDQMYRQFAFSSDGNLLVAGGETDGLALIDRRVDRAFRFLSTGSNVKALFLAENPNVIRTVDLESVVRTFGIPDGTETASTRVIPEEDGERASLITAAFRKDGMEVALGYLNGDVLLASVNDGQSRLLLSHEGAVTAIAYSPDGKTLASCGGRSVLLTDVETGRVIATLLAHHLATVDTLAVSASGQLLAAGCGNGTILLFDMEARQPLGTLSAHTEAVFALAFHPNANFLLSGSADRRTLMWTLNFEEEARKMAGRNLTGAEWRQYLGTSTHYEQTFSDLPDGDDVTLQMKEQAGVLGRWLFTAALLAWIPFTLSTPWFSLGQLTAHNMRLAAGLAILGLLLAGSLVPTVLIPGTVSVWLDRGVRLLVLGAFALLAAWAQRYLDLDPSRIWNPGLANR